MPLAHCGSPNGLVQEHNVFHRKDLRESCLEKSFLGGYRHPVGRARASEELDGRAFSRNFRRLLHDSMEREGISARQVAQDIHVGEDQVSRWRNGTAAVPGLLSLLKIAIRFRVSVDVLLIGVHPQYDVLKSVQKSTALKGTPVANSALPERNGKGRTHGATQQSAADLIRAIEAREHILELTRRDIHNLTRLLYEAGEESHPPVPAKPVTRGLRRNHNR